MTTKQNTKPEPHDSQCQCYCIPIIDDPTMNITATAGTEGKPELLMSVTRHEKAEWKRLAQDAYNKGKSEIGDRFNDYASDADFIRLPISIFDELQKEYRDWLINGFATPPSDQPHKRQEGTQDPYEDETELRRSRDFWRDSSRKRFRTIEALTAQRDEASKALDYQLQRVTALSEALNDVTAQRDELLGACKHLVQVVRTSNIDRSATSEGLKNCDAISVASAAIASVEGKQ